MCDVAQGLIVDPLFFQKGILLSGIVIVQRTRLYVYIPCKTIYDTLLFYII